MGMGGMAMGGIGASSYQEEEEGEEEGTQPLHRMNDDMNDGMNNDMGGDGMGDKRLIISELEADLGIDLTSRLDFVQRVLDGIASEARKHGK